VFGRINYALFCQSLFFFMILAEYNAFFCAPKAIKVMKNMHYLRHTYKINNCFFLIENDDVVFLPENTFRIISVSCCSFLIS
jgi:hypothetical protein